MSMVESGLGISILPELILKRVPYRIAIRELDVPALRTIAFCLRDRKNASLAVKRFLEYLDFREEKQHSHAGKHGKIEKCRTKFCGMCRISLEKLDILPNK